MRYCISARSWAAARCPPIRSSATAPVTHLLMGLATLDHDPPYRAVKEELAKHDQCDDPGQLERHCWPDGPLPKQHLDRHHHNRPKGQRFGNMAQAGWEESERNEETGKEIDDDQ